VSRRCLRARASVVCALPPHARGHHRCSSDLLHHATETLPRSSPAPTAPQIFTSPDLLPPLLLPSSIGATLPPSSLSARAATCQDAAVGGARQPEPAHVGWHDGRGSDCGNPGAAPRGGDHDGLDPHDVRRARGDADPDGARAAAGPPTAAVRGGGGCPPCASYRAAAPGQG
jgi:hypothetical protein